jgi:hypothetical protein
MQQALHQLPQPLALVPNFRLGSYDASWDPIVDEVLSHFDGILDESGYRKDATAWLWQLEKIVQLQQQNVPYYVINQFPTVSSTNSVSNSDLEWALASYLMRKEYLSGLWVSGVRAYGADTRYPAYNAQIGAPMGEMYGTRQSRHLSCIRAYRCRHAELSPCPGARRMLLLHRQSVEPAMPPFDGQYRRVARGDAAHADAPPAVDR